MCCLSEYLKNKRGNPRVNKKKREIFLNKKVTSITQEKKMLF